MVAILTVHVALCRRTEIWARLLFRSTSSKSSFWKHRWKWEMNKMLNPVYSSFWETVPVSVAQLLHSDHSQQNQRIGRMGWKSWETRAMKVHSSEWPPKSFWKIRSIFQVYLQRWQEQPQHLKCSILRNPWSQRPRVTLALDIACFPAALGLGTSRFIFFEMVRITEFKNLQGGHWFLLLFFSIWEMYYLPSFQNFGFAFTDAILKPLP